MIGNLVAQTAAWRHTEPDVLCHGHSQSPMADWRPNLPM
jgi:hypothetical protein